MPGTAITTYVAPGVVVASHETSTFRYFNGRKYHTITTRVNAAIKRPNRAPLVTTRLTISTYVWPCGWEWPYKPNKISFRYGRSVQVQTQDDTLRALWAMHLAGNGVTGSLDLEPPF